MKTDVRFDQRWRAFLDDGRALEKHVQSGLKSFRLAKACAYRMAKGYREMNAHQRTELVNQIHSEGKSADEFLAEKFRGLQAVGEDVTALFRCIEAGMTLKQYLSTSASVFLWRKKRESTSAKADQPLEPAPADTLSMADQVVLLRQQNTQFRTIIQQLRGRIRLLEQKMLKQVRKACTLPPI